MESIAVILAAGQGTRMKSALPKVLHPLLGRPLISYTLQAAGEVTGKVPLVVIGHGAEAIRQAVGDAGEFVLQEQQLGTGHALYQAVPLIDRQVDLALVIAADMPLLQPGTLQRMILTQAGNPGPITILTVFSDDSRGFGRVMRGPAGGVIGIVEEAQATLEQLAIKELNTSAYCFSVDWLRTALPKIRLSPKGEYYLTDLVEIAASEGHSVQAISAEGPWEAIGINNRVHLAEVEAIMRQRINEAWMLAGVTLVDPANTYIEPGAEIGSDTTIWPNTFIQGQTRIGANCSIGPNTIIRASSVGDRCRVFASIVENAVLDDEVNIGPYSHLRRGAHLDTGVHVGNYGEVKNSYLGPGVKMGHFSYIGDANLGANVNVGAGTITCNFDGEKKNHTEIGAGVFIGSDTMLIAPLTVGEGARTGAGAVVTKNVPEDTLVVGVPARAIRKLRKRE